MPAALNNSANPPAPQRSRWLLWFALMLVVVALLSTLVWLAQRYEASQVQSRLEGDAAEAVDDIRGALTHNIQTLQALQFNSPTPSAWATDAASMLREHRELLRIEWLDADLQVRAQVQTPFQGTGFNLGQPSQAHAQAEVLQACTAGRMFSGPAYSSSYFEPFGDGLGMEVMVLCLPLMAAGKPTGFLVASYALPQMLADLLTRPALHSYDISFTEGDGTRLAVRGTARRRGRVFSAQHLLDLPGNTLVLRIDSWRQAPDLFPNLLTALVAGMSLALLLILALLAKDMRLRLRAEHDLADALAFRKAMEDSLITGLRARDVHGNVTYVNPAFCQMVGFEAEELLGHGLSAPYWPPELLDEYQQRQTIRLAGNAPPRQGFESVFMRKNGQRFPVLIIEAPLINAVGQQTGWMSAFIDLSEQRREQEQSRASHERLQATARLVTVGEMASLLSHELNQPLAAISSYATGSINLLHQAPLADPQFSADLAFALARITEQAERAGKVIKSVRDFVRRRDQTREEVEPQALLDAILPLVNLQARKLHVRVRTDIKPNLPRVLCDKTMVEQVILNLARNAMQSMDQPGLPVRLLTLRVGLSSSAENKPLLAFSVADLGPGISPDIERQLFTPFFTTKAEGMGLGLSLCRTVAEQHGGTLRFEANRPHGTIFTLTLPASTLAS